MGNFRLAPRFDVRGRLEEVSHVDRPLTVSDIVPANALRRRVQPAQAEPPKQDVLRVPTTPYDQLLWRAYIHGANWAEDLDYDDWDDADYFEGTPHGQGMLADFFELLESAKPKTRERNTTCALGRPLRDHARRCHPECTWKAS